MIIPETTREKLSKEYLALTEEMVSKTEAVLFGLAMQVLVLGLFGFHIGHWFYQLVAVGCLAMTGVVIGKTVRKEAKINEIMETAAKKGLYWNEERQEFRHA